MCNMSRWKTQALAAFTGDRIEIPQSWCLYDMVREPGMVTLQDC